MTAQEWNQQYAIGTEVIYRPIKDDDSYKVQTRTRSAAWNLRHDEPVVMIEGKAGGVALWALEIIA